MIKVPAEALFWAHYWTLYGGDHENFIAKRHGYPSKEAMREAKHQEFLAKQKSETTS